jgi:hypothetical protein
MTTTWAPPLPCDEETGALGLLMARFPDVPIWFGNATRHWWALEDDRLIEAVTPEELERVLAYLHPWQPHPNARPYISMSQGAPTPDRSVHRSGGKDRRGLGRLLRRSVGSWSPAAQ